MESGSLHKNGALLLTSILINKLGISPMYYMIAQEFAFQLSMYIMTTNFNFIESYINISYILYLSYICAFILIIALVYYGYMYGYDYYDNYYDKNNYVRIQISENEDIQIFTNYVELNSQFYGLKTDINLGEYKSLLDLELYKLQDNSRMKYIREMNKMRIASNIKVKFNDKLLDEKGFFIWRTYTKSIQSTVQKTPNADATSTQRDAFIDYLELYLEKPIKNNTIDIVKKIKEYVKNANNDHIKLNYIKIIKSSEDDDDNEYNHVVNFFEGKKISFELNEKIHIDTLFHPEKDRLWSIIKNSILHPEFYKTKGQTARVSLLLYGPPGCGKSSFAYRIAMCLYRQIISLDLRDCTRYSVYQILQKPNESLVKSYKDALYLFEEFDISIKELDRKSKSAESLSTKCGDILKEYYDNIFDEKTKKKYINIKKEKENRIFTIRDLLEIFQGPIPFEGMIIMANTNKYDEIKEICPELFRPGRLTPVYFGYIDESTLQDISMYYFNRKLSGYIPHQIKIPTSQIIEIALESSQIYPNDSFTYFSKRINILLDEMV